MPWSTFYLCALLGCFTHFWWLLGVGVLSFVALQLGTAIVWNFLVLNVRNLFGVWGFGVHVFWYLNFIRIRQLVILVLGGQIVLHVCYLCAKI